MKNKRRSAFTIVELVIVIAVIAILSAVLIPTFGAIIKDANIAADQTAASTLTTELHVYLKGDTIDNEAELVAALNDEKLGFTEQKLTPKAAAYGVHFWFDMANQMIVAKTADEIIEMVSDRETAAIQSGVALMADGAQPTGADINFRAILGGGFFLIDKGGSSIVDLLAKIDAVKDAETYNDIALYTLEESDKDYELANKILNAVKSTVILSDYGAFYCTGAESYNVYVAMGTQCINTDRYVFNGDTTKTTGDLPTLKGAFTLPKNVLDVATGALNFTGSATVKVPYGADGIKKVFGPQSTNATIKGTDNDYKVINVPSPEDDHAADRLVLASDDSCWVADLFAKLPFDSFDIAYDAATEGNVAGWVNNTLYLSYAEYVGTNQTFYITHGEDKQSYPGTSGMITWTSNNSAVADFDSNGILSIKTNTTAKTGAENTVRIKASAININGDPISKELDVVIVKPIDVVIGMFTFSDADTHTYKWLYNGRNPSKEFAISDIDYNHGLTVATGTPKLDIDIINNVDPLQYADNNLTLTLDHQDIFDADGYTFNITVDEFLTQEVTVKVVDQSDTPIEPVFTYENTPLTSTAVDENGEFVQHYYHYYIGNQNSIKLSDLYKFKDGKSSFGNATLKIYAYTGNLDDKLEITQINSGVSVDLNDNDYATGGIRISDLSTSLQFTGINDIEAGWRIVVEVTPDEYGSTYVEIVVVDAHNAYTSTIGNYLSTDDTALSSGIVLHGDVSIESGKQIILGENCSLYGNGHIIAATTYVSTDKIMNDYLIGLNGGVVDNVFILGPVYDDLDYNTSSKGYHVSGINVTTTGTIQNSYLSGFRQPVKAAGTSVDINNTTLRGGNYANLQVAAGNVNLLDVTTIQDQNGIRATVGDTTKYVTGLGIAIEDSAVNGEGKTTSININGYLDQYNWIAQDQTATLPIIDIDGIKIDMKHIIGMLFKVDIKMNISYGLGSTTMNVTKEIQFIRRYIHEVKDTLTGTTKQYINLGIMFLSIGNDEVAETDKYKTESSITINDNRSVAGSGNITKRNFDYQPLPRFSEFPVASKKIAGKQIDINAARVMGLLQKLESGNVINTNIIELGAYILWANVDVLADIWSYNAGDPDAGTASDDKVYEGLTLGSAGNPIEYVGVGYDKTDSIYKTWYNWYNTQTPINFQ